MIQRRQITVDGNEAAASVAYRASEVIAIYPITPSSTMGELADEWAAKRRPNLWGGIPEVVGMHSGAGRARPRRQGTDSGVHGEPGPAAHDPQHVQDRRGAYALRHARRGAHLGHPRPVHLWR